MFDDVLFIVNPVSGKKRNKALVFSQLEAAGVKTVRTGYRGHAELLAREASEKYVVAVGGDGTVNEVARGLLGTDKIMGIIPCGSGDGLALDLGISRNIFKALKVIEGRQYRTIDTALINGRPFFSTCGTGLDAIVSRRFASSTKRGLFTYIREAVSVWRNFRPDEIEVTADGNSLSFNPVILSVCNSRQWGNGAEIAPQAVLDDGLLDVVVIDRFSSCEIPLLAFRLLTGRLHKSCRYHRYLVKDVLISRQSVSPVHYDGDYLGEENSIHVQSVPSSLKVLVP